MRIVCAQINPKVADIAGNCQKIIQAINDARDQSADLILFPELALCGYPPEDFLYLTHFTEKLEEALQKIM